MSRRWRSLKYECVCLHAWDAGSQARAGVGRRITFCNHQRPHAAHGGQPPAVVYFNPTEPDQQVQAQLESAGNLSKDRGVAQFWPPDCAKRRKPSSSRMTKSRRVGSHIIIAHPSGEN